MTTPSDTQSLILSRAATRPGNLALPLPEGLVGAAAKMVVGKMIAMLQRPEGATVAEMVKATGWLAHTVRGCISGALKRKLGLPIAAERVEGRGTVYRLSPNPSC